MTPREQTATREVHASADGTTHFRCGCGRSVAAPVASPAADERRCSRCRRRRHADQPLHRTDVL